MHAQLVRHYETCQKSVIPLSSKALAVRKRPNNIYQVHTQNLIPLLCRLANNIEPNAGLAHIERKVEKVLEMKLKQHNGGGHEDVNQGPHRPPYFNTMLDAWVPKA